MVIQESQDLEEALSHLIHFQYQILDKLTLKENLGELHLKLKQYEDSAKYYDQLIKRNPENTIYYKKLLAAKQLVDTTEILKFYEEFMEIYPKSMPPQRLPLNIATGELFKVYADTYLRKGLRKGVPPLFVDMRSLYEDKEKVAVIENLMLQYADALKDIGKFCHTEVNNGPREPASALLWVFYYLAQHYDHLQNTEKALSFIDAAIEHTPTLIELYVTKGRIYKVSVAPNYNLFLSSFLAACRRSPKGLQVVGRSSRSGYGRQVHQFQVCQVHVESEQDKGGRGNVCEIHARGCVRHGELERNAVHVVSNRMRARLPKIRKVRGSS